MQSALPRFPGRAQAGARRKWNLNGQTPGSQGTPGAALNFGGQDTELWCPGGERAFLEAMVAQSAGIPKRCRFTSLVAKADNPSTSKALAKVHPADVRIVPMAQGQKQSRLVAKWTYRFSAYHEQYKFIKNIRNTCTDNNVFLINIFDKTSHIPRPNASTKSGKSTKN